MEMNLELHELCEAFPRMAGNRLDDLCEDIKKNGLLNPIVTFDGKVLDGGNIYLACCLMDVEPVFVEYEQNDPVGFVVSQNLERRNLTQGQAATAIALLNVFLKNKYVGENQYKNLVTINSNEKSEQIDALDISTVQKRAKEAGVSVATQQKADAVVKQSRDIAEKIIAGNITLNEATKQIAPQLLNKPKHEDAQEFSKADELMCELEALRDAFKDLEIKIATQNYDGIEPLPVIVDELRIELKHTKIELEAITQTRDTLLNENAQLKRQLKIVQSKVKNG